MSDKLIRKITFHIYKNKKHEATQETGIYKYNQISKKEVKDPFKLCKNLDDVREILLRKGLFRENF